jgi:hypothetical protein
VDWKDGEFPAKTSAQFPGEVQRSLFGRGAVVCGQYGRRERCAAFDN